jgi:hypothetical protein
MYAVADFSGKVNKRKHRVTVYDNISSAISYFISVNKDHHDNLDISVQANINKSNGLLVKQHQIYHIDEEDLEATHIKNSNILNISIFRNDDMKCKLRSILFTITNEDIEHLSEFYNINTVAYNEKRCDICKCNFLTSVRGSDTIYNPVYYEVVSFQDLELQSSYDYKKDDEIMKIISDIKENVKENEMYCLESFGGLYGFWISKTPLPSASDRFNESVDILPSASDRFNESVDVLPSASARFNGLVHILPLNILPGSTMCWSCKENMGDNFICMWAH